MREPSTVGERIRVIRRREELSIDHFAAAIGYSKRAVINWEQNAAQPPIAVLEPLKRLYGADPEWIATGKHSDNPRPAVDWERLDRLSALIDTLCSEIGARSDKRSRMKLARDLFDGGADADQAVAALLRSMIQAFAPGRR